MPFDFQPLGDRVLVRPIEPEDDKTPSGIILLPADAANKELPQMGEVLAMGSGGVTADCGDPSKYLQVGQRIYFNKYAGHDYEIRVSGDPSAKPTKVKMLRLDAVDGTCAMQTPDAK